MDIQKEREAFECEFKQTDYYIAHGDLSTLMLCDDQYALDDVQVSFEMWKAAKAQAVPEGFVVLTIDDVDRVLKCLDDDAVFITYKASDALESIRKAMINEVSK